MSELNELVGLTVLASIGYNDKDEEIQIKGKIINIDINDYFFYEKSEPIYITVNIEPLESLPEGFDYECLSDILLSNITKF